MKKIETSINIDAPVQRVWQVLTDFENYGNWNPFLIAVKGTLAEGEQLVVSGKLQGSKPVRFKPTVLKVDPKRELRWKGEIISKFFFEGEHYFQLIEVDSRTTRLIHGENFRGILLGMLNKTLKKTEEAFYLMNQAMKEECER